ncbi:F-box protein CPR30-like [Prunus avium]|uniref:F-box protein CPR30-like n=1 Tax=Prunus avium TaxID=42229 RepID=A0A6P5SZ85_PRUAV|nr:F-box protein CPR30-like [Prunus avium]
MSNIPQELIFDILSRLESKDLIRYTCVSKAWYALIHNQDFIKAHLQLSIKTNSTRNILFHNRRTNYTLDFLSLPFDNDEMLGTATKLGSPMPSKYSWDIVGYANGLVCLRNYMEGGIALWNPSIQKLKKIPEPYAQLPPPELDYGFGYDSTNDDYKLVQIVELANEEDIVVSHQVRVYSLKANSWKRIQDIPSSGYYVFSVGFCDIVFLNGALGWLMCGELLDPQCKIVTLDLASEKYRVFPIPVDNIEDRYMPDLKILGDYLCICLNFRSRRDVWIMKEFGETESWSLLYSIDRQPNVCVKPLAFSKNGEMVLLEMLGNEYSRLSWYDLEKKSVKQVEISGLLPLRYYLTTVCWGSLCLLDGDPVIAKSSNKRKTSSSKKRKTSSSKMRKISSIVKPFKLW